MPVLLMLSVVSSLVNILFLKYGVEKEFEERIVTLGENLANVVAEQFSFVISFEDAEVMQDVISPLKKYDKGSFV